MIDLRHPLAVFATRLPWAAIEAAVAHKLEHPAKPAKRMAGIDLAGAFEGEFGGGISPAGQPRVPVRLMISLLYLKNSFNLSDEDLVERWAENAQWQFFGGMDYYEPRLPCDATQIGRFRRLLGEDGLEQLFKATIESAVEIKAVRPADLERVIVDNTVQSKAIVHPVDSRLLEFARHKVVSAARRASIACKQNYAKEGKTLRRKAGGYGHTKQFKRLRKTVKRQRTILGVVMREVQRKLDADRAAVAAGGLPANEPDRPNILRYCKRNQTVARYPRTEAFECGAFDGEEQSGRDDDAARPARAQAFAECRAHSGAACDNPGAAAILAGRSHARVVAAHRHQGQRGHRAQGAA